MEDKSNLGNKLNLKINELVQGVSENLVKASEIKNILIDYQKYEKGARLRGVEKLLETAITELKNLSEI